jgi:cysteine desulfurase
MSVCYLDANATTFMPELVIKTMVKWINKGNPSSHYNSALECKELINVFINLIKKDYDLTNHTIIFTSGASESNSHILTSTVRSFAVKTGHLPHIIISSLEHKSILQCCEDLRNDGLCQYTKLDPGSDYGTIDPIMLENAIKPNTCLISIMAANNETGIINDIPLLTSIAHKHKIPFHTDCVQHFGKYGLYNGADAYSISFHKLYGPPGIGCLIIRNNFINGYGLKAMISGNQNYNLRGGTENIPAIGAAYAAYKYNFLKRDEKNKYLLMLKNKLKQLLSQYIECFNIEDFEKEKNEKNKIFFICNKDDDKVLYNTLLLSVYKDNFCNIKMKKELNNRNIIVSIGSACNSNNNNVSPIIKALGVPKVLYSGVIRISLLDDNTIEDVTYFVNNFINILNTLFN